MRISPGERAALQTRFKLALDAPAEGAALPEDLGVATVGAVPKVELGTLTLPSSRRLRSCV